MPEGDTVHTIANYLAPRLVGTLLVRGRARDIVTRLDGRTVERVYCQGKHLFIQMEPDLLLRSHLGMHGQWHRYDHGARWKRPARQASVELETSDCIYVLFNAREVELMRQSGVQARVWQARLGPDLVSSAPQPDELLDRVGAFCSQESPIADVLLSQRVASGIGNVYKSELLFLAGVHPARPWQRVPSDTLYEMYQNAHELLVKNISGSMRQTRFENDGRGRLWVYGRRDQPCLRCQTPIESASLGMHMRPTYWCSSCQI